MTIHQITVKNIHCGDCMRQVKASLLSLEEIREVEFMKTENKIAINGEAVNKEQIVLKLAELGYRELDHTGVFSKPNSYNYWYCYCCSGCES